MSIAARPVSGEAAKGLARRAADWLVDGGSRPDVPDVSLYGGEAGVVLALTEAHRFLGDDRYGRAAEAGADVLSAGLDDVHDASLYFGLTGIAVALGAVGRVDDVRHALRRVRRLCDERQRWGEMFELLMGNAGIGLGAVHAGDLDLAVRAVTPYLTSADRTEHGVNWQVRPSSARSHHVAHGTLGIVLALATVGAAAGRDDMVEMALAGAADVVHRDEAAPGGFLVPHSDPPHRPDVIERYSYGWCNGPTGDAQVFRLLRRVTADESWSTYEHRCWHTVVHSGLPRRTSPGFWDNSGRCCGTAGVLALACDRAVERGDGAPFGDVLVGDLLARAVVDDSGARWSNVEHRAQPSDLPPRRGWAMGNAGILRELLRWSRVAAGSGTGYAVPWPDHPVTAALG